MSSSFVDQNLLFGFLALQNDFIPREELIAAVSVWLTEKSRKLDEILRDRQALDANEHELLKALVRTHIERHGGDVEKSLASLSSVGSLQKDLQNLGDADVNASIAHVSREQVANESDPDPTLPAPSVQAEKRRYRILRPHAEGGLGQVFVAQDEELNREVALKEIKVLRAHDQASRSRFLLEAEITGRLEHPGIVPVYGLGQYDDGRPFYAMRFIRGDSLKEAVDRFHQQHKAQVRYDSAEFRKLLGRFIDVCDAIEYAHSRGILHRDLKPANIMLGKYGETLVVDWGLARAQGRGGSSCSESDGETTLRPRPSGGSSYTQMGEVVGTPAFMSPEQALGRLDQLSASSDVYSLGATLYYVLTGQPPFKKDQEGELLRKVQRGEFAPPRSVNPAIPRPLDAICQRAMSLHACNRYASPHALADDVEKYLADEPVVALPDSLGNHLARLARRHRTLVRAAAVALLVVTIVSTVAALLVNEQRKQNAKLAQDNGALAVEKGTLATKNARLFASEREAKNKAVESAAREKMANDEITRQLRRANALRLAAQSASVREQFPQRAGLLAIAAVNAARAHGEPVPPLALQALLESSQSLSGEPLPDLNRSPETEYLVGVSADGQLLISMRGFELRVRQLNATGLEALPQVLRTRISNAKLSGNQRYLLCNCVINGREYLQIWDLSRGIDVPPAFVSMPHRCMPVSVCSQGRWLLGNSFQQFHLWDVRSDKPEANCHHFAAAGVVMSHDGHFLAVCTTDGAITLYDTTKEDAFATPRVLDQADGRYYAMAFSFDNRWLACEVGSTLRLIDLSAETRPPFVLHTESNRVGVFAFSPDSRLLATTSYLREDTRADTTVRLWNLEKPDPTSESLVFQVNTDELREIKFSLDNRWLAVAGRSRAVFVWNRIDSTPLVLNGHDQSVVSLAFSPDGSSLFTAATGESIRKWNLSLSGLNSRANLPGMGNVVNVAIRPDGRWLATRQPLSINLWDLHSPELASRHIPKVPGAKGVAFSRDSQWLATIHHDKSVRLWDQSSLETGLNSAAIAELSNWAIGKTVASIEERVESMSPKPAKVWSHDGMPEELLFTPDGRFLIVYLPSEIPRIFPSTIQLPTRPPSHLRLLNLDLSQDKSHSVEIEPLPGFNQGQLLVTEDSRWLIAAGKSVNVWDLTAADIGTSARCLPKEAGERRIVVAASPDSHLLVTAEGKRLQFWDLRSAALSEVKGISLEGPRYLEATKKLNLYGRTRWHEICARR